MLLLFPFVSDFKSHLLYLLVITTAIVFAVALNFIDARMHLWERYAFWGRYLIIVAAYAVQMIFLFIVSCLLDSKGLIKYYGSDPEGGIGMLFFPSVVIYAVIGGVFGFAVKAIHWRKNRSQSRS